MYFGCPIATIGLDRLDNNKGYTLDNVVSMCAEHNRMKKEYSLEKLVALCKLVVQHYDRNVKPDAGI